jgi:DNA-binding transcriptional ArsR family regulator
MSRALKRRLRPAAQEPEELESVWRALSSPVRRRMLDHLRDGHLTTGELAAQFPELSRFAVMQHLSVLAEVDLVRFRRYGRERHNYLNPVPIQRLHDRWVTRYLQPWTEALVRLRDKLENGEEGAG